MRVQLDLTADEQRAFSYMNEEERAAYFDQLVAAAERHLAELFAVFRAPLIELEDVEERTLVDDCPYGMGGRAPACARPEPPVRPVDPLSLLTPEERSIVRAQLASRAREEAEWERRIAYARSRAFGRPTVLERGSRALERRC
jgi:hypothetical protein